MFDKLFEDAIHSPTCMVMMLLAVMCMVMLVFKICCYLSLFTVVD